MSTDRPKVKEVDLIHKAYICKVKGCPSLFASRFEYTVDLGLANILLHAH